MVKTYLESRIIDSLESNDLIKNHRVPIYYKPENVGEGYRKTRQWMIKNFPSICFGALGVAGVSIGFTSIYRPDLVPEVATGIGAIGFIGAGLRFLGPLDRFLYFNPKDIARRYFMSIDVPWHEAYNSLEITSKRGLDGYVYMAQTPSAIKDEFHHHESQVTLGVTIARVADYLSELSLNSKNCRISGLTLENLIDMMIRQKMGTPEETELIRSLHENYSTRKLAKTLRKAAKKKLQIPGMSVLQKYSENFEFVLRISEADSVESIGAQISRGCLHVTNSTGPHTACYAGMHSRGYDFPRVYVKDDVGHSLMTHSKRGLTVVGGNSQQGVLNESSGGIVVVEGVSEHSFCHKIDDTTWPIVGISVGGLTENLNRGDARNGLVVSLNRNLSLGGQDPKYYIFRDGEISTHVLENNDHVPEVVARVIDRYISEWKERNP